MVNSQTSKLGQSRHTRSWVQSIRLKTALEEYSVVQAIASPRVAYTLADKARLGIERSSSDVADPKTFTPCKFYELMMKKVTRLGYPELKLGRPSQAPYS